MVNPDEFLQEAATRPAGEELSISIRELLSLWDAKRRGYWVVETIREDLGRHGLRTVPSFETGWIDNHVRLFKVDVPTQGAVPPEHGETDTDVTGASPVTPHRSMLRVGTLASAESDVVSVRREDSLEKAQSLMLRYNYSQLPVVNGREIHGSITWESIGRAAMHSGQMTLTACIVSATVVELDDDLLVLIPRIIETGHVYVRRLDRAIGGVITTADLSSAFRDLAGPFLLIGEIERKLRQIIDSTFALTDLRAVHSPDDPGRAIQSVDDLTFGEYVRLFESRERWESLGWSIDRQVFIDALGEMRILRNEVMHFSPDPIEAHRVERANNFLKWLMLIMP